MLIVYLAVTAVVVSLLWRAYKKWNSTYNKSPSRAAQNAELVKALLNLEDQPLEDLFNRTTSAGSDEEGGG